MSQSLSATPYFIDFEASSLSPLSYPIEVAWGKENDTIESFLISPAEILEWNDWSEISQRVHGIQREELIKNGSPPKLVATKLIKALEYKTVYSDNPDYDGMWLKRLIDVTQLNYPPINILHLDSLLIETVCPTVDKRIMNLHKIIELKYLARKSVKMQHRAYYDVEYLITVWKLSKELSVILKN